MAIEDAATLGVILPLGTLAEEVPERLRLYQKIRKARVEKIQEYTRQAGLGIKEGTTPIDSKALPTGSLQPFTALKRKSSDFIYDIQLRT